MQRRPTLLLDIIDDWPTLVTTEKIKVGIEKSFLSFFYFGNFIGFTANHFAGLSLRILFYGVLNKRAKYFNGIQYGPKYAS